MFSRSEEIEHPTHVAASFDGLTGPMETISCPPASLPGLRKTPATAHHAELRRPCWWQTWRMSWGNDQGESYAFLEPNLEPFVEPRWGRGGPVC